VRARSFAAFGAALAIAAPSTAQAQPSAADEPSVQEGVEPPEVTPPVPDDTDRGWRGEVAATAGLRFLFDLDVLGGGGEARAGFQVRHWLGVYWGVTYFRGQTLAGLLAQEYELDTRVDFLLFAHLHFGLGVEAAYFTLKRATDGTLIKTPGVGFPVYLRYDLFYAPPYAVYTELRADIVSLDTFHNAAGFSGPSLAVGFRF